jgi:hypothetical protein
MATTPRSNHSFFKPDADFKHPDPAKHIEQDLALTSFTAPKHDALSVAAAAAYHPNYGIKRRTAVDIAVIANRNAKRRIIAAAAAASAAKTMKKGGRGHGRTRRAKRVSRSRNNRSQRSRNSRRRQ